MLDKFNMVEDTSITGIMVDMVDDSVSQLASFLARLPRIQKVSAPGPKRRHGPRPERGLTYHPNGTRECARRKRQIEAGQCKLENGLSPEWYVLTTGGVL